MPVPAKVQPLGVRADLSLSVEQSEMVTFIEGFDLWFVEERLESKGRLTGEGLARAVTEFKRYMALVGLGYRGLGMLDPEVDEIWHSFILFTREYAAFCQSAFGTFIHHVPRTSRTPASESGADSFRLAYSEVFGVVPAPAGVGSDVVRPMRRDEPAGCGTEDCTDG